MLRKTPLYELEEQNKAHFTEFAGWELPLYYTGIIDEHMAVRIAVGLFDISHLGKIEIKGNNATSFMQSIATADIEKLQVGRGTYTLFCNDNAGILDDEIVYRLGENEYLTIPNAARTAVMLEWFNSHKPGGVEILDHTDGMCLLALQGQKAGDVLQAAFNENPVDYKRYTVRSVTVNGNRFTVMKSGYTGEDGYEIFADAEAGRQAWQRITGELQVKPCGLAARDTLRLEMGFPLYGHELTEETTPVEAGLERSVSLDKGEFIGRDVIARQLREGVSKRLMGFILDQGIARDDALLRSIEDGKEIGRATSGGYSPVLKKGIGMAYIDIEYARVGIAIEVPVRNKVLQGRLAERPFIEVSKMKIKPLSKAS